MENVGENWSLSDPRDTDPEGNYFKLNPHDFLIFYVYTVGAF